MRHKDFIFVRETKFAREKERARNMATSSQGDHRKKQVLCLARLLCDCFSIAKLSPVYVLACYKDGLLRKE